MGFGHGGIFGLLLIDPEHYFMIPHSSTLNIGKGAFLELGLVGNYYTGQWGKGYLVAPLVGFRVHFVKKVDVTMRVHASYPIAGNRDFDLLYSPVSVTVGVHF